MKSIKEIAKEIANFSLVAFYNNPHAVRAQLAVNIEQALRDRDDRAAKIAETHHSAKYFDVDLREEIGAEIAAMIRKEDVSHDS